MPERKEYAPGTPSWIDLATPDIAGVKQFYGPLFGWQFSDGPQGAMFNVLTWTGPTD